MLNQKILVIISIFILGLLTAGTTVHKFYSRKLHSLTIQNTELSTKLDFQISQTQQNEELYNRCKEEVLKNKADYESNMRKFTIEITKLKRQTASYESIKPKEGLDTCQNLIYMLDQLARLECENGKDISVNK